MKFLNFTLLVLLFIVNQVDGQNSKAKSLIIGNKWVYDVHQVSASLNEYHLSEEVLKDTTIELKDYATIKSEGTNFRYQRADSTKIYEYFPRGSIQSTRGEEFILVDFNLDVGDSIGSYVVSYKSPIFFFGKTRLRWIMYSYGVGLVSFEDWYVEEIGLVYRFYDYPGGYITYDLIAAKIENVIYGDSNLVDIEMHVQLKPLKYELYPNYPNPFNPTTKIKYDIINSGNVSLKVYDFLGNEVGTLVNEEKQPGSYEVEFESAIGNQQLASGIYFYQLRAGEFIQTKKMILLR